MGQYTEIAIKQKVIRIDRLLKFANKYRQETIDNPLWTREDHLHLLNFLRFIEKEMALLSRPSKKKKTKRAKKPRRA